MILDYQHKHTVNIYFMFLFLSLICCLQLTRWFGLLGCAFLLVIVSGSSCNIWLFLCFLSGNTVFKFLSFLTTVNIHSNKLGIPIIDS